MLRICYLLCALESSGCTLNKQQVPLVTLEAAERNPGLWAWVLLDVWAAADPASHSGRRRRTGWFLGQRWDPCGERDGHTLSRVAVSHHETLTLLGLLLPHALDLCLAGFSESLYCLVLVLFSFLGGLQASLSRSFLSFLHHLCRHLFLLVAHGKLQKRLALLLV